MGCRAQYSVLRKQSYGLAHPDYRVMMVQTPLKTVSLPLSLSLSLFFLSSSCRIDLIGYRILSSTVYNIGVMCGLGIRVMVGVSREK